MVNKRYHLSLKQEQVVLNVFEEYTDMFDGKVSTIPDQLVKIEFRKEVVPYYAHPYTTLRTF